jgi:1-deoxy-D-xylulose-5-phosphate synthase
LQDLHVVFVMDRAGMVGADGPTHHGVLDLSFLRCIPKMVIMAPKDENELRDMLFTAVEYTKGPVAIRYPRGNCLGLPLKKGFAAIPVGKAEIVRAGNDVAILAVGTMVNQSLLAADILKNDGILAEVVNMKFIKPLDAEMIDTIAARYSMIVTVEENSIIGGFGSGVAEHLSTSDKWHGKLHLHGLPDHFITHGSPAELLRLTGLDAEGIASVVKEFFHRTEQTTIISGRKAL